MVCGHAGLEAQAGQTRPSPGAATPTRCSGRHRCLPPPGSGCLGRGSQGLTGEWLAVSRGIICGPWLAEAPPPQRDKPRLQSPWTKHRGWRQEAQVNGRLGKAFVQALKHSYYYCEKERNSSSWKTVICHHPNIFKSLQYSFLCNLHEMRF